MQKRRGNITILEIRSPESQVVSQELHNQSRVLVRLFRESVQFGNGIIKGLFGEMTGPIGRIKNLIVKDGEVQGES